MKRKKSSTAIPLFSQVKECTFKSGLQIAQAGKTRNSVANSTKELPLDPSAVTETASSQLSARVWLHPRRCPSELPPSTMNSDKKFAISSSRLDKKRKIRACTAWWWTVKCHLKERHLPLTLQGNAQLRAPTIRGVIGLLLRLALQCLTDLSSKLLTHAMSMARKGLNFPQHSTEATVAATTSSPSKFTTTAPTTTTLSCQSSCQRQTL